MAIGLLALLCLLAFSNTFGNEFVYDDQAIIVKNGLIKSLMNIPEIFTRGYWTGAMEEVPGVYHGDLYRPLTLSTYAINHAMGGLDPFGYHLVNLLLQLAVSVTLFMLTQKLGFTWSGALAASLLFATHPLHAEAVTGIVGRAELLMALGVLLALTWYIDVFEAGNRQDGIGIGFRSRYMFGSWAAFAMALLSKEQAMVLPILLILYDLTVWKGGMRWKERMWVPLFRHLPYFLILGSYLLLRGAVLKTGMLFDPRSVNFLDNPLAHVEWYPRFLTSVKVAGKYLWLCVWPQHLSADYSYNAIPVAVSVLEPQILASILAWGGLLGLAAWSYFRGTCLAFFCVGFTLLTFLPVSNFLIPIGTIMGERLFYLPSAGLALLVAAGWDEIAMKLSGRNISRLIGMAGLVGFTSVLFIFTVRTFLRNRDWRDGISLYQSALRVVPRSAKMRFNVGTQMKNFDEALKEYQEALRIYPDYARRDSLFAGFFGSALLEKGRVDEAVAALERAVVLGSKFQGVHYNLGLGFSKQERWEKAEDAYRSALVLDLQDPAPWNGLSFVLWKQGRYEEALKAAEEALRLKAEFWEARYNRARSLDALGRLKEAAEAYDQVLQLKPLPAVKRRLEELRRLTQTKNQE